MDQQSAIKMDAYNDDGPENVEPRHKGNHCFRYGGDTLKATDYDKAADRHDDDPQ